MSLSYLGGAAAFRLVSGSSGQNDKFGWDNWSEKWAGPPTKFEAFRRDWPKNKEHRTYKWLYLVDFNWTEGPEIEAVLQFRGALEKDSKEHVEGSVRLQPLTLKGLTLNGTAQYYGPVSTWRYIVVGDNPTQPAHAGELLQTAFDYQIINQRGSTGKVGVSANRGVGDSTAIPTGYSFLVKPRVVTSRFDFEQVGGCWQVTEENEGRLESFFLTGQ